MLPSLPSSTAGSTSSVPTLAASPDAGLWAFSILQHPMKSTAAVCLGFKLPLSWHQAGTWVAVSRSSDDTQGRGLVEWKSAKANLCMVFVAAALHKHSPTRWYSPVAQACPFPRPWLNMREHDTRRSR
ncbi:hypothetical protein ABPG77_010384 [Micractinium sp. CCAP 211/92]